MSRKTTVLAAVLGLAIVLGVALRTANRADAAAGNCYTESKGPSEPTICS
jgi:hypothetical protein